MTHMNRLALLELAPARLVAARRSRLLTQAQLAQAMGVSTRTVKRWEATGRIKPAHWLHMQALANVEEKIARAWRMS